MRFLFWTVPNYLIRTAFYLAVFLTPVLGVWLASSLVAFINGPTLLAAFSGLLLFPIIPLLWDLRGQHKRKTSILSWGDRLTLRTLILNLVFIGVLLAVRPQTSFLALSTRGDWFLDGRQGPQVGLVRQGLFKAANGVEWLYLAFHSNPYEKYADTNLVRPTSTRTDGVQPTVDDATEPTRTPPQPTKTTQPNTQSTPTAWPWQGADLHPAIVAMPASAEQSIESVAQYIAQQEKDPILRIKALHDYVADRIAYENSAGV